MKADEIFARDGQEATEGTQPGHRGGRTGHGHRLDRGPPDRVHQGHDAVVGHEESAGLVLGQRAGSLADSNFPPVDDDGLSNGQLDDIVLPP